MEFYASCPTRFEADLANELRAIGALRVRPLTGRVAFEGEALDGLRACLWSRLASRVCVVLGRVAASSEQELYEGVYSLPWEDILRVHARIAIAASGTNRSITNSHFAALRAKDALCDRIGARRKTRPTVDTQHPDARIVLSLHGERATVALDLAGEPLFKRLPRRAVKYLTAAHADALRPDYAALALARAGWNPAARERSVLVDAACKTGGILLEAIDELLDRAPGLGRATWGFQGWAEGDPALWHELMRDAEQRASAGERRRGVIIACDADARAQRIAAGLLEAVGLADQVAFTQANAGAIAHALHQRRVEQSVPGAAIVLDLAHDPITRIPQDLALFRQLCLLPQLEQATAALLAPDASLVAALPLVPSAVLDIKPDNDDAVLAAFDLADAPRDDVPTVDVGAGTPVPVQRADSEQFARRLIKVARQRRRWAERAGITCYRVYDADLPEYAASIDLYQGAPETPGRWLVVSEYAAPKDIDPAVAQARMLDILSLAPRILDVDPAHVHARVRTRSRGGSQYGRRAQEADTVSVKTPRHQPRINEDGLSFIVNFNDYLDTGIFLDHRVTRHLLREEAAYARSFLNLFAYTGTATCYAAAGGAERTTTVDLSNTYLDWARANMRINGFSGPQHSFVRADVMSWVREQRHGRTRWDLIFCDPPTFSNSAKMGRRTFDVQRDHVELLIAISRLLTPGGRAVFSCNLRTFRPDLAALERAGVSIEDVTAQTIPEDFARNQRIHKCYLVERTPRR